MNESMNKRGGSQKKDEVSCQDKNISIVQQMYIWNWEGKFFPWMIVSSVQSLSRVWLFANPWTTVHQASLSNTNT